MKKKFSEVELNNYPFFLSCTYCYNSPEIILKDDKYIIINCPNCNIIRNENLENISNYSSEWITNKLNHFCDLNHNAKTPSSFFCRTCNNFFCTKCLKYHNQKHNKDLLYIKDLKLNFCNSHNKPYSYFCVEKNCEICVICKNVNKKNNFIPTNQKKYGGYLDLNEFELFLEKAELIKKKKYLIISKMVTIFQNALTEDRESYELLKNIISDIIKEFYKDLKIEQNLIFFAKTLFVTIKKINNYNDFRVKQYTQILEVISQLFTSKEVEKFQKFIDNKIYIYKVYINKLSNKEEDIIKQSIDNILHIPDKDSSNKVYNLIENISTFSEPLKKYVLLDNIKNSNNYLNINEIINNPNNFKNKMNSSENGNFIISILSKYFEEKGIEIFVSTKKDREFRHIESALFFSLINFGHFKKYEFYFDFGQEQNINLMNSPLERAMFIENYKYKISRLLNIGQQDIIMNYKDFNRDSIIISILIINLNFEMKEKIKSLQYTDIIQNINFSCGIRRNMERTEDQNFILKIEEKPFIETIMLNTKILEKRLDKIWKKNKKEKRGGYDYIIPEKDWIGIGVKAYNLYNGTDNTWINCSNQNGEFTVAYSGLNPCTKNKLNNLEICLYQNPKLAENTAGIVNVFGYKIMILLMYKIDPNKIRKSDKYPEGWIMNPTSDEIRPYRILLKIIPSLLTDKIKISFSPINYIISAFKSNDTSFYQLSKDNKFKYIATLNRQKINYDFFTMRFYSSNYYSYLNNYLRSENSLKEGNSLFNKNQLNSWIFCLQLALQRNRNVKNNIIVYRGIRKFKFEKEVKEGTEFYFREFVSTSLKKNVALGFMGENGTLLIISIKNNGCNGSPNYCYNIKDISIYSSEDEILISSHCCFEVDKIIKSKKIDEVYLTCKGFKIN